MYKDDNPPKEAVLLAKRLSLPIRKSENISEVVAMFEPEIKLATCSNTFVSGRIWALDIFNEFIQMTKNTKLVIDEDEYFPKILELHAAKFRPRINSGGTKTAKVYVDDACIWEEEIREHI